MLNANPLNPEWPHAVFNKHPDEIHISPRSAYFTKNGKVHFLRLEDLTQEDVNEAYEELRKVGVIKNIPDA